jgi:hypothetical protein
MSESFGHLDHPAGPCEIHISGEAAYDDSAGCLTVALDAQLRTLDLLHKERLFRTDWLPEARHQTEHVAADEASDAAREIFNSWVRRVRDSVPTSGVPVHSLHP